MLMKPLAVNEHLFNKIIRASKHFLCDDVEGRHNVCGMILKNVNDKLT